ncbi:MAG: tRNA epoxyqueuosine(34) reductase QueG [Armatimonadetes bacterium]|nr:tRNA epoxyqueuosine(34) reductase QueG [Armatimonadota bacterium]
MLKQRAIDACLAEGFDQAGIAPVDAPPNLDKFHQWLADGYAATMGYMHRWKALRADPKSLLPTAKSAIVAALSYAQGKPRGKEHRIAQYAWGKDYHKVVREKFRRVQAAIGVEADYRICVDSAPILERDLGLLAGIGWYGKNSCLIDSKRGSLFFLGVMLTSLELEPDKPAVGGCGTCRACIDACPTGAIVEPYRVDSSRCISYLTIEHRGPIDDELKPKMGDWIFGCDVCQDVCPFNQARASQPMRAAPATDEQIASEPLDMTLEQILALSEEDFRARFQGSAIKRAKRAGIVRNGAIAAKNRPDLRDRLSALTEDEDEGVRDAARWALEIRPEQQ